MFLLSRFNLCKTSVKGLYFRKITDFFPGTFCNINIITGNFQGFYLDFKQFFLFHTIFPEDFPMVDLTNFKVSFQQTNNRLVLQT